MRFSFKSYLPAAALLLGLASCSEDFEVMAPAKPITVVYGVLDPADTAHYVRIQRAFGSENANALDLSKLPDSSYFANLTVSLQENLGGGYTTVENALPRVDLNAEGYTKQPGDFFTTPSYAYKFKRILAPGRSYRLLIKNNDNGNTDTAETVIPDLTNTLISELFPAYTPDQKVELTPTNPTDPSKDPSYSWRVITYPQSPTVRMMDAVIRFHFWEKNAQGQETEKVFDHTFAQVLRQTLTSGTWEPVIPNDKYNNFYVAVGDQLGTPPTGVSRYADSVDLIAYFGTEALYQFRQSQRAIGGLAGDQVQYRYTNIRGKDVLGLFAARAKIVRTGVPLTKATVREMKTNPGSARANIVDTSSR